MRSLISIALLTGSAACAAGLPYFSVMSGDPGAWPAVLSSIGLQAKPAALAHVFVARTGAGASPEWRGRVERGAILIIEGESSLAEMFGFRRSDENVRTGSLIDIHQPKLPIVWEHALELPRFAVPAGAIVFAKERWDRVPMMAGLRRGAGAVLWVAVPPGDRGHERFPYLLQALTDLGMEVPFRSTRLWAFFDSSYRTRVDLDYFCARWRRAGIAALHVAGWHYFEADRERDAYVRKLIEACHREGILVYAWLELPHVSDKFWNDHPEWREKTALQQDAHLDWRRLMNLQSRGCFRAVSEGVGKLIGRFDWDGVNLAELYFESLEGIANPSRFTPLNEDVRAEFRSRAGFDPLELFNGRSDEVSRREFLTYRADLARRMQEEWMVELEKLRTEHPHLDLVLTHVDDRFDNGMRNAIGADAARVLPLANQHNCTFLIEDPATVWHMGPERYREIAASYRRLSMKPENLAIDLNIVDRYQNVYPTRQQTGVELFQLVHQAASSFERVAVYGENSLAAVDLALLPSAAAAVSRVERLAGKLVVDSPSGVGIPWRGGALVDGEWWPVTDGKTVWLPAGAHAVEEHAATPGLRVVHFSGAIRSASVNGTRVELSYQSQTRAIAVLSEPPERIEVDGTAQNGVLAGPVTLLLPRGQHVVTITSK